MSEAAHDDLSPRCLNRWTLEMFSEVILSLALRSTHPFWRGGRGLATHHEGSTNRQLTKVNI